MSPSSMGCDQRHIAAGVTVRSVLLCSICTMIMCSEVRGGAVRGCGSGFGSVPLRGGSSELGASSFLIRDGPCLHTPFGRPASVLQGSLGGCGASTGARCGTNRQSEAVPSPSGRGGAPMGRRRVDGILTVLVRAGYAVFPSPLTRPCLRTVCFCACSP